MATTSENHNKRNASDEINTQAKRMMINHSAIEQEAPSFTKASALMKNVVDDKIIIAEVDMKPIQMPEITDHELLQMAQMFENKHGQ
jgi:hypothetical protein